MRVEDAPFNVKAVSYGRPSRVTPPIERTFGAAVLEQACTQAWLWIRRNGSGEIWHEGRCVAWYYQVGTDKQRLAAERGECRPHRAYWSAQANAIAPHALRREGTH